MQAKWEQGKWNQTNEMKPTKWNETNQMKLNYTDIDKTLALTPSSFLMPQSQTEEGG